VIHPVLVEYIPIPPNRRLFVVYLLYISLMQEVSKKSGKLLTKSGKLLTKSGEMELVSIDTASAPTTCSVCVAKLV